MMALFVGASVVGRLYPIQYNGIFGAPDKGQMQYVWGGQTIKAGFPKRQGKDSPRHCLDAGLLVLMQDW
jgi:hypothetical protein